MDAQIPVNRLLFEVTDRLVRLLSHVQRVSNRVDRGDAGLKASVHICSVVEDMLKAFCGPLVAAARIAGEHPKKAANAAIALRGQLQACHLTFLHLLPHPGQPVELRSFVRQVASLADLEERESELLDSLFATERLTDQAFELDPSDAFSRRANNIDRYLREASGEETYDDWWLTVLARDGLSLDRQSRTTNFISMPLIDLQNPCRWPSLTHEMAHHHSPHTPTGLFDDFAGFVGQSAIARVLKGFSDWHGNHDPVAMRRVFGSWLMECYCDAYGAIVLGYSNWFSQLQAFFFTEGDYLFTPRATISTYPPAFFRLRVLEGILTSRYEYADPALHGQVIRALKHENAMFHDIVSFIPSMQPIDQFDPLLANLSYSFVEFLRNQTVLQGNRTRANIEFGELNSLIASLNSGEPIPVAASEDKEGHRRCAVGEILLAGWLSRNSSHAERVCQELVKSPKDPAVDVVKRVQLLVERFDESLKRSVQVAEWIDLLKGALPDERTPESARPVRDNALELSESQEHKSTGAGAPFLLVDHEIKSLLRIGHLKIIPLINEQHQIGANSIDVRLGHNFELFFSNMHGPLDVLQEPSEGATAVGSRYFEVDQLDGIVLSPGEFMLAHTLEYVALPHDLAGQLDGRSSFARLGIQIHMTAGFVDAGFRGSLTLEIANFGAQAVKLYPGMRVGQLRFFRVSRPAKSYGELPHIKYRGFLSHNKTKQWSDPEVQILRRARSQRLTGNTK